MAAASGAPLSLVVQKIEGVRLWWRWCLVGVLEEAEEEVGIGLMMRQAIRVNMLMGSREGSVMGGIFGAEMDVMCAEMAVIERNM